ncbi:MAG TPA: amino acid permease [Methanothermobacter sp.]|nr:amino acid permease-associated region [Methanothermobacter sp. MT-2]HHW04697.1 amino acid permease [Methanothermobacter sp.]HOK72825.1 amino acid permease [Methanothermobacter sp.]HOL69090.1 amino acid permease [Methanothermobacter sp.]HPQ04774.1 amino acid permease [Methanothermobacter sp.]
MRLRRALTLFDVVNLVIGTIVGADIYIVAAVGAGTLGPASILSWLIAGFMAIIIALVFAEASSLLPRVGGPYAYAKHVFGDFLGFVVGWSLWVSSWVAIAVFPVAFVSYLLHFIALDPIIQGFVKVVFIVSLTMINYKGVKLAGKVNDALTVLKLAPLFIFAIAGLIYFFMEPGVLVSNYVPFAPYGFGGLGSVVVLVFWAYVGFELVTVPSDEVIDPEKTIPKAIILGMVFIMLFYLITNFVILGVVPSKLLANSSAPLALAGYMLLGSSGAMIMTLGALFSISGSEEAGILSTARILYAMASDGLLPRIFASVHPRYKTPYVSLVFQNLTALLAALLGTATQLISISVFTLLFCYILTCISLPLLKKSRISVKAILGFLICVYLMINCSIDSIIWGLILTFIGIPLYLRHATHQTDIYVKRLARQLQDAILARRERRFLARFLRSMLNLIMKLKK